MTELSLRTQFVPSPLEEVAAKVALTLTTTRGLERLPLCERWPLEAPSRCRIRGSHSAHVKVMGSQQCHSQFSFVQRSEPFVDETS